MKDWQQRAQHMKSRHLAQQELKEARRKAGEAERAAKAAERKLEQERRKLKTMQRAPMFGKFRLQRGKVKFREPNLRIEDPESRKAEPIDFGTFSELAKASVTEISQTKSGLALILSSNLKLEIEPAASGLDVKFVPNPSAEVAVARVWLLTNGESGEVPAALIEERLWHVRQLYALIFLLLTDGIEVLADALREKVNLDLEPYVPEEHRLLVRAFGVGSAWLDAAVKLVGKAYEKVKKSPDAALKALSLITSQGREKAWRRVDASTRTKEAQASQEEAKARKDEAAADKEAQKGRQERLKTAKTQVDVIKEMVDTIEKIKDPEIRKLVGERLRAEIAGLNGKQDVPLLPPS